MGDYLELNLSLLPATNIESHNTASQFQIVMPIVNPNTALSEMMVKTGPIPMIIIARMIRAIIPNVFMWFLCVNVDLLIILKKEPRVN